MVPTPLPVPRPTAPHTFGDADGAVIQHAGRYARECVLVAFEMIGGVERMADWANKNPGEFYTKLFPKVITREVEHHASGGVEDLLARLDAADHGARDGGPVLDGDYSIVEEQG